MRRLHVWFLAILIIVLVVVLSGLHRTSAKDQTVDFRLSQIMVKLNQIEWELSQVRNRLGSQDQQLADIDRQLERIRSDIEDAAETAFEAKTASEASASPAATASEVSTASASPAATASEASETFSAAIDPALVGVWRLSRNQTDDAAEWIRRNLKGNESGIAPTDSVVRDFASRVETALNLKGLRYVRFDSDGSYRDEKDRAGIWTVYGDRLFRIGNDGNFAQVAYLTRDGNLSVHFTRTQVLSSLKIASKTWTTEDQALFEAAFDQTDGFRVSLIREE